MTRNGRRKNQDAACGMVQNLFRRGSGDTEKSKVLKEASNDPLQENVLPGGGIRHL